MTSCEQNTIVLVDGHTHMQQFLRCDENWYVNPSCIGFAYHWRRPQEEFRADPLAEYGLLTMAREQLGVEFRHNSFDVESMLEGVRNSGRPHIESTLAMYGWVVNMLLVRFTVICCSKYAITSTVRVAHEAVDRGTFITPFPA